MKKTNWISKVYIALVMLFLYLPIFVLIFYSFNENKSRGVFTGFTLDWYKRLFHNETIITAFFNTMLLALVSSILATLIGTIAAIGLSNLNKWLKTTMLGLTYVPVVNPEIITGVSLAILFVYLKFELNFSTILFAHITFNVPYVILNVLPKFRQMDKFVYDAALDLGCPQSKAFMKVVIPEIMPGIIAGFLMSFTYSLDDFIISHFTTGPSFQTLPIVIYSMTRRRISPEINALSTLLFIVVLTVLVVYNVVDAKKSHKKSKYKVQGGGSY